MQHQVHQRAGFRLGAGAKELALGQGDFPALRTARLGLFVIQDANQQARLGVVHVLLDPRHAGACEGFLTGLAHLEPQAAQALGLLLSGRQAFGNPVPLAHLRGGAAFGHAVVLLGGDPSGQRVSPPQLGLVWAQTGDLEQLAQAGLHLLLALARVLAGRKGAAVEVLLIADPLTAQAAHALADVVEQAPAQLWGQAEQIQLFLDAQVAANVEFESATRHGWSPRPARPPTVRTAQMPRCGRRPRSRRRDPRSGTAAR